MKPETHTLLALALFLAITPWAFTQDGAAQPCPEVPRGTMGCELVAWSHLQEPVPLPEPESKPVPPADQQPGQSPTSQTQPQASRQTITGVIVRQGEKYVLKAGDNTTYQLDDQDRARRYQHKRVMVVGRLDANNTIFQVESIELVS
jgi:Protein of unknown function (DUF5818)